MDNQMITRETIDKENFVSFNFQLDTIEKFLTYFMQILMIAYDMKLISKEERDLISDYIIECISEECDGKAIGIANFMYIITLWLLSMDAWSALEELKTVSTKVDGHSFLVRAEKWLKRKLSFLKIQLTNTKNILLKINNEKLLRPYYSLLAAVEKLERFRDNNINLKEEHMKLNYSMLIYFWVNGENPNRDKFSNYLEKLENLCISFKTEMQIFQKIKGAEYLRQVSEEQNKRESEDIEHYFEVEKFYKNKINQLSKEYHQKRKDVEDFEKMYDSLSTEEQLKIDASEINKYDIVVVENEYHTAKRALEEAWDEAEKKAERIHRNNDLFSGVLEIESEVPSLCFLIKNFALYVKCKRGEFDYPETEVKKSLIINNIKETDAISEVLRYCDILNLNQNEIKYLEKNA